MKFTFQRERQINYKTTLRYPGVSSNKFNEPQLPHLANGDNNVMIVILQGLNELIQIKHFERCLGHTRSINVSGYYCDHYSGSFPAFRGPQVSNTMWLPWSWGGGWAPVHPGMTALGEDKSCFV